MQTTMTEKQQAFRYEFLACLSVATVQSVCVATLTCSVSVLPSLAANNSRMRFSVRLTTLTRCSFIARCVTQSGLGLGLAGIALRDG